MKVLEQIKKQTIIVCNYAYQKAILEELNLSKEIYNIKFFSLDLFIKHYYFSYDDLTIAYLMDKYKYSYDNSVNYLRNLLYINEDSTNPKLHLLYSLKEELLANHLLYFDDGFKDYIKNFDIFFVGIPYFKKLEEQMISELNNITYVEIILDDMALDNDIVYEASTIDDEVTFVADRVSELISKGILLEKIKLTNIDSDYINPLTKIFGLYGIPINISKHYLYGLDITSLFLNLYDEMELDEVFRILQEQYKYDFDIIKMIIDIVNKYILIDDKKLKKEFIINGLKKTNIAIKYSKAVEVVDYLNDYIANDDYVFLLNFNQNAIPKIKKDEDYITDFLKVGLPLDMTSSLNKKIKDATIRKIKSLSNLVITYKNETPYRSFYPANLINETGFKVQDVFYSEINYSKKWAMIELSMMLNKFITYGTISDKLGLYYHNFPINYMSYNNKFKGIDKEVFSKYFNGPITLSYSSMNDYYLCKFKYYVANILKLDIYEETFAIYIGNLFHYVLQHHFMEGKNVDILLKEYVDLNPLRNAKEKFFVNKLRNDLYFVVDTIHVQMKECSLDKALYEERQVVSFDGNVKITFKGFIDKLLYSNDGDETIVAIIDYKTGSTDIDMSLVAHGLSLQLPVYLYLAKNNDNFKNIVFAGFYLQKIIHEIPLIDAKNGIDEIRKKNLKLSGYSNYDDDILYQFDHSYKDSRVINSMKLKNDGSYSSYAKVLTNLQFDNLISLVQQKIVDAGEGISKASFTIDPKEVNDVNLSCCYCKFRDICFRSPSDIVVLQKEKDLSFLGGDTYD